MPLPRTDLERLLQRLAPLLLLALSTLLATLLWRASFAERAHLRGDTRFYRAGAERLAARQDLYLTDRVEPDTGFQWPTGYTYLPPFAVACQWTTLLPYRAVRALWLALALLCALALWRLRPSPSNAPPLLALTLLALPTTRFLLNDLAHGQVNLLLALLLLACWRAASAHHDLRAGAALGVALTIKPTAWPLAVWFAVADRRPRLVLALIATALALELPPLLWLGLEAYVDAILGWIDRMQAFAAESAHDPNNASLTALGVRLGLAVGWARAIALLVVGVVFVALARRPHTDRIPAVVLLGAWASPVTWKAHLVVLVLALWPVAARLARAPAPWTRWAPYLIGTVCLVEPWRLATPTSVSAVTVGIGCVLLASAQASSEGADSGDSGDSGDSDWAG